MHFAGDNAQDVRVADTYLLQVHGRTPLTTYATQVPLAAASLNTNDCFVFVSKDGNWIWLGKGSTGDEREMAKGIVSLTDSDPSVAYEGKYVLRVCIWGKRPVHVHSGQK